MNTNARQSKAFTLIELLVVSAIRTVCAKRLPPLGLLLFALPATLPAQDYTWTTNGDGITLTITGYTGPGGGVTIPDKLPDANGLPVTSIGDYAFYQCFSLTSLTIPSSVTNIGESAFYYCTSLSAITVDPLNPAYRSLDGVLFNQSQTTLIQCPAGKAGAYTIPSSVTNIGDHAFYFCTSLSSIAIPSSVTSIRAWAFAGCNSLTSIIIPDSVTTIEYDAFISCTSLSSITIPSSVTSIAGFAFCTCTSLSSITIPSTVTTIGSGAFETCTSLISVKIPASVNMIGPTAFARCTSLEEIMVDSNNAAYSSTDGVLFDKSQSKLLQYPSGKAGGYTIPDSVTTIQDYAFSWSSRLTSVAIGNNVTSIAFGAFKYCTSLSNVIVGSNVTDIGGGAFYACDSLPGLYFRGNAPTPLNEGSINEPHTTIYRLPGTTGWGTTFSHRLTALWRPRMLAADASNGVQTNQFGFNITWASGMNIAVDACTNLAPRTWFPLQTNTLTADTFYFSDPDWTNSPRRFYRVRWPGASAP